MTQTFLLLNCMDLIFEVYLVCGLTIKQIILKRILVFTEAPLDLGNKYKLGIIVLLLTGVFIKMLWLLLLKEKTDIFKLLKHVYKMFRAV